MSNLSENPPERHISGGRYMTQKLIVHCLNCDESSLVVAESEYGATIWLPEECPFCEHSWEEASPWEMI